MDQADEKQDQDKEDRESDGQSIPWRYAWIFPSIFLLHFGLGINSFVLTEWTHYKIRTEYFPNAVSVTNFSACSSTNYSDPSYVSYKSIQTETARWTLYYSLAAHIPNIFASMIVPTYMDTYGRKYLFIVAAGGMGLKLCVTSVVINFNLSLFVIVVVSVLEGMTGSNYSLLSAVFSYVADVMHDGKKRVLGIVIIESSFMLNTIFSGLLAGKMVEALNFKHTSIICASITLAGFFLIVFVLPESLSKANRKSSQSVLSALKAMSQFYFGREFKEKRLRYILLILSFAFAILGGMQRASIETIYFLGKPFCWSPAEIGYFSLARHASLCIIGMGSVKLMQLIISNQAIAVISTISHTASFIVEGLASSTVAIYMVPLVGVFGFLMMPMLRGIISAMTPADKQGAVFASIATMESICSLFASLMGNEIYTATLSFMNGFVFLEMAFFCFIDTVLLCILWYLKPYKDESKLLPADSLGEGMV